jgi:hypothetical protein
VKPILLTCLFIASCAAPAPKPDAPLRAGEVRSAHGAKDSMTVGKSTKADVRAALGEALVIDFDSGYEVWVYKERLAEKATPPATELVLLFAPSGILTKTRIR